MGVHHAHCIQVPILDQLSFFCLVVVVYIVTVSNCRPWHGKSAVRRGRWNAEPSARCSLVITRPRMSQSRRGHRDYWDRSGWQAHLINFRRRLTEYTIVNVHKDGRQLLQCLEWYCTTAFLHCTEASREKLLNRTVFKCGIPQTRFINIEKLSQWKKQIRF